MIKAWFLKKIGHKQVGGLHFVRVGRLGFSFYIAKGQPKKSAKKAPKLVDRQLEITYN